MKALITGCDGFVGRHFTRYLKEMDWDVYGLDIASDPTEDAFRYFVDGYDEWFDLIVHSAYEVGGRAHIDGTNMALAHNVAMDASMFDWALKSRQGAVLYFSSSAAYPTYLQAGPNILREEDIDLSYPMPPDANYGWAKVTGEKVAQDATDQGLRVHVVRPFSGYSHDQSLQYPFPSIVKRVLQNDLTVWGPPGQTRDWIHIDDVVAGAFAVYEADERRPVNLCTGVPTEMGELAKLISREAHLLNSFEYGGRQDVTYLEDKPTGVFYRVGNPTRMNELYTATISIEEGVRMALGRYDP
jgi:nucleoside-diphosphate-sugar epimerase